MNEKAAFLFHSIPILVMVGLVHVFLFPSTAMFYLPYMALVILAILLYQTSYMKWLILVLPVLLLQHWNSLAFILVAVLLSWQSSRTDFSTRVVGVTNFSVGSLLLLLVNNDSHLIVFLLLVLQLVTFLVEMNVVKLRQQVQEKTFVKSNYKAFLSVLGIMMFSAFFLLPTTSFLFRTAFPWIGDLFFFLLAPVLLFLEGLMTNTFSKVSNQGGEIIKNEVPIQSIVYEGSSQESMFVYWLFMIVLLGIISLFVWRFAKMRREPVVINPLNDSVVFRSSPINSYAGSTYKPNTKLQKELNKLLMYAEKHKAGRPVHETLQDWLENREVFEKDTFSLYEKWRYGNVELNEEEEKSVLREFAKVKRGIRKK